MAAHAVLTLFFLLSGQWLAFLLNAPLVAFNVNKYVSRMCDAKRRAPGVYTDQDGSPLGS